jgi:hypothetical protein
MTAQVQKQMLTPIFLIVLLLIFVMLFLVA